MNATHDFTIRISPESGRVTVENDVDGVITHKEISRNTLIPCQVFAASQSQSPGWQGDLSLAVEGTTGT